MTDTVNVPGLGPTKKTYVYAGAAACLGIVVYVWFFRPPPEEEDAGVEPGAYDVGDIGGAYDYGTGEYTMPGGSVIIREPSSGSVSDPSTAPPTNNADWTIRVTEALGGQGYDPLLIARAVGKYFARTQLTSAEAEVIRFALAAAGPPPQGTYSVILQPAPTTPAIPGKPTGLKATKVESTAVSFSWSKVSGAAGYRLYRDGIAQNIGHSVDTSIRTSGLKRNTTYRFRVRALNAAGKYGEPSAWLTVKTKK